MARPRLLSTGVHQTNGERSTAAMHAAAAGGGPDPSVPQLVQPFQVITVGRAMPVRLVISAS